MDGPVVFFWGSVCFWFGKESYAFLLREVWKSSFSLSFQEQFEEHGCSFLLECSVKLFREAIRAGAFVCWDSLDDILNVLHSSSSFCLSVLSLPGPVLGEAVRF